MKLRGLNTEPLDLDRHDVWIRKRFHANESAILRPQNAVLKICKVVELSQFSRFVSVVQVTNEPVRGITQDILLDRGHLLRRVNEADAVLGALLCSLNPNVLQIILF